MQKCPKCGSGYAKIVDSRVNKDGLKMRRRACRCGERWTTLEILVPTKQYHMTAIANIEFEFIKAEKDAKRKRKPPVAHGPYVVVVDAGLFAAREAPSGGVGGTAAIDPATAPTGWAGVFATGLGKREPWVPRDEPDGEDDL